MAAQSDFYAVRAVTRRFQGSSSAPTHERGDSAARTDWGLRVVAELEPNGLSKGLLEVIFTATLDPPSAISLMHLKLGRLLTVNEHDEAAPSAHRMNISPQRNE